MSALTAAATALQPMSAERRTSQAPPASTWMTSAPMASTALGDAAACPVSGGPNAMRTTPAASSESPARQTCAVVATKAAATPAIWASIAHRHHGSSSSSAAAEPAPRGMVRCITAACAAKWARMPQRTDTAAMRAIGRSPAASSVANGLNALSRPSPVRTIMRKNRVPASATNAA